MAVNKTAWADTQEGVENEKRRSPIQDLEDTNVEGMKPHTDAKVVQDLDL